MLATSYNIDGRFRIMVYIDFIDRLDRATVINDQGQIWASREI